MTLINRLIKQAKSGAQEVCVPENKVRKVSAHIAQHLDIDQAVAAEMLRNGEVKLLGAKMRVIR